MISPHVALEVAYSYRASVRGVPGDTYYFIFYESLENSTPVDVSTWTILAWLSPLVIMNTFDQYDFFVKFNSTILFWQYFKVERYFFDQRKEVHLQKKVEF